MARKTGEMPKVSIHSASHNARVRIGGKTHWLGRCPAGKVTREQLAKAARLWQEHLAGELGQAPATAPAPAVPAAPATPPPPAVAEPEGITLAALGVRYLDFAQGYYRTADGGTTSSVDGIRMALKALFPFSDQPAAAFGPKSLKRVQELLVREGERPPQPLLTAQIASRVDLVHPVSKEAGHGAAGRSAEVGGVAAAAAAV